VKVEKRYEFDGPGGKVTLAELFRGRSQLVVYHFMFGPEWQEGCPSCSFTCDHVDGALAHIAARDVTLLMVSRGPLAKIEAFKQRMGWRFEWVSSQGSDFDADFHVCFAPSERAQGAVDYNYTRQPFPSEEAPGVSVFTKDAAGDVFDTYSSYGRGIEPLVGTYMILDIVPRGRDEDRLAFTMEWVRHHDRYASNELADADRPYWAGGGGRADGLDLALAGRGRGRRSGLGALLRALLARGPLERFERARHALEALGELLDIGAARQVEHLGHALEGALHHGLEVRRREGHPVAAARAQQPAHVALQLLDALARVVHALAHGVVEDVAAALEQLGEQVARDRATVALGVDQDLRERHRGDVLAALVVDHLHLLVGFEEVGDALERDVAAGLGVVELAVRVALDQDGHDFLRLAPREGAPP
jgi:predicted dithiol-disulfide oxidoreductase (DUF899 family)